MKSLPVLLFLIVAPSAFCRDFLPKTHFENVPASDSSIQESYIIRTTAGVRYTVQFSNDLIHWANQDEVYGLGHEYVVPMRQFTPPPPPPPGEPAPIRPAPAVNTSIRMQRISGIEGGTLVSWASLDHGGPMVVRIAGEMAAEWFRFPLFSERVGGYYFFFWHPYQVVAPPTEVSTLGAKDSAMLAILEANLPAMNARVTASLAAARNAPPPAPADPDSKRFWRILVNPDIDTDRDGSPDWAEFEIAARAAAAQTSSTNGSSSSNGGGLPATGDTFNADTNNDGIPDGEQLDADDDGTPDSKDPDSTDNTTFIPVGSIPRYALFEIPGNAIQINDLGTVVYSDKTWKGGVITPLPSGPAGSQPASARSINDLDVIIGTEG